MNEKTKDAPTQGADGESLRPVSIDRASLIRSICDAIRAADDKSVDETNYMLDSDDCIKLIETFATRDAAPSDASMPNLDDDWSPISETLVHRLRDPIPAHALADMPDRMAEAINVIREEAAHAIESLCGQFRELEYIMECSKNAKFVAALNLNLESGLGDGGLLDANIEAARATPADHISPEQCALALDPLYKQPEPGRSKVSTGYDEGHNDALDEAQQAIRALKSQQDAAISFRPWYEILDELKTNPKLLADIEQAVAASKQSIAQLERERTVTREQLNTPLDAAIESQRSGEGS